MVTFSGSSACVCGSAAGVAEGFGDGSGAQCTTDAQHRRVIGGHRDHDRARTRLTRDLGFEKVRDFAAALADQANHDDVGLGGADHHPEQH